MNRTRRAREKRLNRLLVIAFAFILIFGVVMQITMMAKLSGVNKEIDRTQREITSLNASAENMNRSIGQFHERERITAKALQLGMVKADESRLRVVNLPALAENTSVQSADSSGAEERMD